MQKENTKIENNIKKYLQKEKMSQKELAKAINSTEVSVSRYIKGERMPKIQTCIKIATTLNCSVEDLYPTKKEKTNNEKSVLIIKTPKHCSECPGFLPIYQKGLALCLFLQENQPVKYNPEHLKEWKPEQCPLLTTEQAKNIL